MKLMHSALASWCNPSWVFLRWLWDSQAATEHDILVALCSAIGDAKTRPATKQKPGKWAVCNLQLQSKQDLVVEYCGWGSLVSSCHGRLRDFDQSFETSNAQLPQNSVFPSLSDHNSQGVQHPEQDAWGDGILAYPKESVVQLSSWAPIVTVHIDATRCYAQPVFRMLFRHRSDAKPEFIRWNQEIGCFPSACNICGFECRTL